MEQELIEKYTKQFGVRFSKRAKVRAMNELHKDFEALGYDHTIITGKKWLSKSNSILYGNMKTAKNVVVVPFDTPEHKFWHKVLYYPFDGSRTANKTMAATFVPIVAVYLIILLFVFFGGKVTNPMVSSIISVAMLVLLIFLVYFMVHGVHNTYNSNRNSASIIASLQIAQGLDKDERKRTAFLFTDKNKGKYIGATSCAEAFKKAGKNPNMVLMDCIARGSIMQIGYKPQNRKLAQEVGKYDTQTKNVDVVKVDENMQFQTSIQAFEKAVCVSCGELDKDNRLVVEKTSTGKDRIIDDSNVDRVIQMITMFIKKAK